MVRRGELTDEAWARIVRLLPEYGRRGGRWREHRTVVNGILWKLRTGGPVAGLARALRSLADLLRPLREVAPGRHLGEATLARANQERRRRGGGVVGERGLHGGPRPPARGWRPPRAGCQGRKRG
jgi:transposase